MSQLQTKVEILPKTTKAESTCFSGAKKEKQKANARLTKVITFQEQLVDYIDRTITI